MNDTTETARDLLWRHNLPEDVIDGALALFAQELAGKIRAHRDHTRGAVQATKVMDFAADLISPENWARTVSAVVPAADRAALRDRIAEALSDARRAGLGGMTEAEAVAHMADAVLSVLPAPADRAAVLRDFLWRLEQSAGDAAAEKLLDDNPDLAALLAEPAAARRVAAETPPAETEAHPPTATWKVESPRRGQWASWGAIYDERDWAQERYESATANAPARPFRLVRATTTYTVEAEHTPAVVAQPGKDTETPGADA